MTKRTRMGIHGGRRMHWVAAAVDIEAGELARPSVMGAAVLLRAQALCTCPNSSALAIF
jgi:hypothetical protein